ncbi:Rho termination factor N-terminal domain-containing protein [Enterococcus sp. LJL128]
MEKTIYVADRPIRLRTSAAMSIVYKNQFGTDYFSDLMKLAKIFDVPVDEKRKDELKLLTLKGLKEQAKDLNIEGYSKMNKGQLIRELLLKEEPKKIDIQNLSFEYLDNLDMMVIFNILWTMARMADRTVPDPFEWLDSFEVLPIEVVLPEIKDLLESSIKTRKK